MKTIVLFLEWASFFKRLIITKAVKESRPDVGSSSRMQYGSLTNSTPIEVLFLSPPEIPLIIALPMSVSAHFSSIRVLMVS